MKKYRILGLFLRHLYPLKRDFDLLSDMVYWPLIDTLLWGLTSLWLGSAAGMENLAVTILMGLVLWNVIWRAQSEVARNLMDEIWNNNLVNLFSTPLQLSEWVLSALGLSVLKTSITLACIVPAILFLYAVDVFTFGWWLPVFFLATTMTGWSIGFISAGIVVRYGPKVQTVIWTLPGILLPLSAVYFPLANLPAVLQPVSYIIPTTYIFEAMRSLVATGEVSVPSLALSFALNIVWLAGALWWFSASFRKSLELGLARFN